jgi:hypothetical protein
MARRCLQYKLKNQFWAVRQALRFIFFSEKKQKKRMPLQSLPQGFIIFSGLNRSEM